MEKNRKIFLITGINGFIGSLIAKTLMNTSAYQQGNIVIIGVTRNKRKALDHFSGYTSDYLHFIEADIIDLKSCKQQIASFGKSVDYLIHCAAVTASSYMISHPVETTDGIVIGTRNMLEISRMFHVKSMVYLSSMEVYGKVDDIGRPRMEGELGEISLKSARSCYSLGKRIAEHYCHTYQQEYGVPVKIARLAQTFGKGIGLEDNRVFMQFARAVLENRDIILCTQGTSIGNYCESLDAVNAIFTILDKGEAGEVYNVVNEETSMSIRHMAKLVAETIAAGKIQVRVELEDMSKTGYAPDTGLRLSGEKLRRMGWKPTKGLVEMYRDLISEIERK